jgi:uncharacterized phage infection (PIP) family protein YhgE
MAKRQEFSDGICKACDKPFKSNLGCTHCIGMSGKIEPQVDKELVLQKAFRMQEDMLHRLFDEMTKSTDNPQKLKYYISHLKEITASLAVTSKELRALDDAAQKTVSRMSYSDQVNLIADMVEKWPVEHQDALRRKITVLKAV